MSTIKTHVHLTPKVINFIVSKMCEGYSIMALCRKWPDKVPVARTIYTKAAERPELQSKLDQGYTVYLYRRIDALHRLASQVASNETQDWRQLEAQLKREIFEMKFTIGCMADKISRRFAKQQTIAITTPHVSITEYK